MRSWFLLSSVVIATAIVPVGAGDEKKKGDEPTEPHKAMAKLVGEYTTASKFTLPDGKTVEAKGAAKLASVLGGRFVQETNESTMMGKPVNGMRLFGYNNASGKFESVWTYTGSTAIMVLIGEKSGENTVDFRGAVDVGKNKKADFAVVYTVVDDNTFTVDLAATMPDGTQGAMLKTTYKRKK
ncbi:MAG: DUF1579 family protein [Planctomycetes bacterium]|nr:DUF1579 family protein [Planctomycetota bacterium]